jgi:hypothetical protein
MRATAAPLAYSRSSQVLALWPCLLAGAGLSKRPTACWRLGLLAAWLAGGLACWRLGLLAAWLAYLRPGFPAPSAVRAFGCPRFGLPLALLTHGPRVPADPALPPAGPRPRTGLPVRPTCPLARCGADAGRCGGETSGAARSKQAAARWLTIPGCLDVEHHGARRKRGAIEVGPIKVIQEPHWSGPEWSPAPIGSQYPD